MAVKVNRQNISEHLLEYQFSLIGKTVQEAINNSNWKEEWRFTKQQSEDFVKYSIPLIKRVFKCNRMRAVKTLEFFIVQFGLKIEI